MKISAAFLCTLTLLSAAPRVASVQFTVLNRWGFSTITECYTSEGARHPCSAQLDLRVVLLTINVTNW